MLAFPSRLWLVALSVALSGCIAVPPEPVHKVTPQDLAHAHNHEYDGRYAGHGMVASGSTCGSGYVPANWYSFLDVDGGTFHLTTALGGQEVRGNVAPNGVLTRSRVYIGQIVDGRFKGTVDGGGGCRKSFDLTLQKPG